MEQRAVVEYAPHLEFQRARDPQHDGQRQLATRRLDSQGRGGADSPSPLRLLL